VDILIKTKMQLYNIFLVEQTNHMTTGQELSENRYMKEARQ
jgi:hypothetical protein